jgi:hypothetical protein
MVQNALMKREKRNHVTATPRLPAVIRPQGGGVQPMKFTQKEREAVETMAGYGMRQDDIAKLVGPHGIDPKTLREHFREELDRGLPKTTAGVSQREPRWLTAAAGSRSAMVATISRQVATDRKSSHSPCPAAVQNQEKGAAVDSVARRTRH